MQRLHFKCKKHNSNKQKITNTAILHVDGEKYFSNTVTVYNTKIKEYNKYIPNECGKTKVKTCQMRECADCLCELPFVIALIKLLSEME